MLVAALLSPCDKILILVHLVKLRLAVTDCGVWEPRAIPPRMAASKWVGGDGLLAWSIALPAVVSTDASRTVALARPRIVETPSTGDSKLKCSSVPYFHTPTTGLRMDSLTADCLASSRPRGKNLKSAKEGKKDQEKLPPAYREKPIAEKCSCLQSRRKL
ncbi:hypothetical protein THAOC_20350 [Thalassiosira oceanica]|uniref:Uncharacterized protein n=1 Tax=Thalassiosira oceanica TaxID=159749 RepID=K0S2F1_THAOC|nr:hypothetical protein THAOC_20350 [Thalassiosira oceanica]|eukprot:EJK59430.1 hypothetical protein THAOC_20350 [Thalassiosira oceanica]